MSKTRFVFAVVTSTSLAALGLPGLGACSSSTASTAVKPKGNDIGVCH